MNIAALVFLLFVGVRGEPVYKSLNGISEKKVRIVSAAVSQLRGREAIEVSEVKILSHAVMSGVPHKQLGILEVKEAVLFTGRFGSNYLYAVMEKEDEGWVLCKKVGKFEKMPDEDLVIDIAMSNGYAGYDPFAQVLLLTTDEANIRLGKLLHEATPDYSGIE